MRYSALSIFLNGLRGNKNWAAHWRQPEPKPHYDVVIVGGGGHGLATAYYLSKTFGIKNIAVVEKGYIGSGNVGRNTTIIRSNYLLPGNNPFYEFSMKLWEGLEQDFNFNAMVSQRGVVNLYHSDAQRDAYTRRGNAMRLHGVDAELLDRDAIKAMLPFLDYDNARFPIQGGLMQRRGGTVRHDAVAWAMPVVRIPMVWTFFKTAKLRAFAVKMARRWAWKPHGASSAAASWRWRLRAIHPVWLRWQG